MDLYNAARVDVRKMRAGGSVAWRGVEFRDASGKMILAVTCNADAAAHIPVYIAADYGAVCADVVAAVSTARETVARMVSEFGTENGADFMTATECNALRVLLSATGRGTK